MNRPAEEKVQQTADRREDEGSAGETRQRQDLRCTTEERT